MSIITVCFNSENTIRETLESVRKVKSPEIEYVVIDGGSSDGTLKILDEYRDIIDKQVSEADDGIYDAMNKGILQCQGEWVAILNSDDYYLEDGFKAIFHDLGKCEAEVYYGNIERLKPQCRTPYMVSRPKDIGLTSQQMTIFHPSCFIKRSLYEEVGCFDTAYRFAADYKVVLSLYLLGKKFKYVDVVTTRFDMGGTTGNNIFPSWRELRDIQKELGIGNFRSELNYLKLIIKRKIITLLNGFDTSKIKKVK